MARHYVGQTVIDGHGRALRVVAIAGPWLSVWEPGAGICGVRHVMECRGVDEEETGQMEMAGRWW